MDKCPNCGADLKPNAHFCSSCGYQIPIEPTKASEAASAPKDPENQSGVTPEQATTQQSETPINSQPQPQYTQQPTTPHNSVKIDGAGFKAFGDFISHNLAIVSIAILIAMIIVTISALWGWLFAIVVVVVGYYKANTTGNKEMNLNRSIRTSFAQPTNSQPIVPSQNNVPNQATPVDANSSQSLTNSQQQATAQQPQVQQNTQTIMNHPAIKQMTPFDILMIIGGILSLYGYFIGNFTKQSSYTLRSILGGASSLMSMTSADTSSLKVIGGIIAIVPIVVIVCAFVKNRGVKIIAVIAAAIEAVLFISIYYEMMQSLGDYANSVSSILGDDVLGSGYYTLLFGAALMLIFSIASLIRGSKVKNKQQ